MGALFSGPPHPQVPPGPPPAAYPATLGSAQVQSSGLAAKKSGSAAAGMGFEDTLMTSPQGLVAPSTAKSTLLGG